MGIRFAKIALITALVSQAKVSASQELNCQVNIVLGQNVQTGQIDPKVFEELETAVLEFVNGTRWTNDIFAFEERIECNFQLTINEALSQEDFNGTLQVTARRPVYMSGYYSTILRHNDQNFQFRYQRGMRWQFTPDRHIDNITSVIAFYCYMILGYDYDSFSKEGGTKYFVQAQQIVANAASAAERGWKANEDDRNRYWLVDNAMQQIFKPLRICYYEYHRLGFDGMHKDVAKGREMVLNALDKLQSIQKSRPGSINMTIFFSAKKDEIISLFTQAPTEQKTRIVNLCKMLDPSNGSKYEVILKG
jgi:hypothetical protein